MGTSVEELRAKIQKWEWGSVFNIYHILVIFNLHEKVNYCFNYYFN